MNIQSVNNNYKQNFGMKTTVSPQTLQALQSITPVQILDIPVQFADGVDKLVTRAGKEIALALRPGDQEGEIWLRGTVRGGTQDVITDIFVLRTDDNPAYPFEVRKLFKGCNPYKGLIGVSPDMNGALRLFASHVEE